MAWVLAQGPHLIPVPGTKRVRYLDENLAAAATRLTPEEVGALQRTFGPAAVEGEQYPNMSFVR